MLQIVEVFLALDFSTYQDSDSRIVVFKYNESNLMQLV